MSKNKLKKLKAQYEARVSRAISSNGKKKSTPTMKVSEKQAWYICYVYADCATSHKVKNSAIDALSKYTDENKLPVLNFVKSVGHIHGVDLVCSWCKL